MIRMIPHQVETWVERKPQSTAISTPGRKPPTYGRLYQQVRDTVGAFHAWMSENRKHVNLEDTQVSQIPTQAIW